MIEIFNEKSIVYKIVSYTLALLGLVFVAIVLMSTYELISYSNFRIGLWGWIATFGGFLLHRGLSDIIYLKKKDGFVFVILPILFLLGVIWINKTWV